MTRIRYTTSKRVSLDENTWAEIQRRLPSADFSTTVNELLFQFLGVLVEERLEMDELQRKSAQLALERINQQRSLPISMEQ